MSALSVMEYDLPMNPYADVEHYVEPILEPPGGAQHKNLTRQLRRKYPTWPAGDHPMVAHHVQQIQSLAQMPAHPEAKAQAADYFRSLQSKDSPIGVHHLGAIARHLGVQVPDSATGRKRATLQALGDYINKGMASAFEEGDDTWKHLASYKGTPGLNAWLHVPTGQDFLAHNYERPVGKQGWMNFGSSHEKGTPRWVHAQTGEFKDQLNDPGLPVQDEPAKVPEHIAHIRRMMGQLAEDYDGSHPGSVKQAQSLLEMAQHPDMREHLFGSDEHAALQDKVKAAIQSPVETAPVQTPVQAEPAAPVTVHSLLGAEEPAASPEPVAAVPQGEAGHLGDVSNVGLAEALTAPEPEERTRRMTGKRWSDIDLDGLQEMANAGVPIQDMMDRFDRSEKSVKSRLRILKKFPRKVGDSAGIPDPKHISLLDTPSSSTRAKAGVRYETQTPQALHEPMDRRLQKAVDVDSKQGSEPILYQLANHLASKGFTPETTLTTAESARIPGEYLKGGDISLTGDEEERLRDVKRSGLAEGHIAGPLRRQIFGVLRDLSSGMHIPGLRDADDGAGRKIAEDKARQIATFMESKGIAIDDAELYHLADAAYNRFTRNPSKEELRIAPEDVAKVKKSLPNAHQSIFIGYTRPRQ